MLKLVKLVFVISDQDEPERTKILFEEILYNIWPLCSSDNFSEPEPQIVIEKNNNIQLSLIIILISFCIAYYFNWI
jgi:hypothetical protein